MKFIDLSSVIDFEPELREVFNLISDKDIIEEVVDRAKESSSFADELYSELRKEIETI